MFNLKKNKKKRNIIRNKAFTLVELIVVVTILGILSTIGFVSYSGYLAGTRDTNRISQLKSISDGLEMYRTRHELPIPDESRTEIKVNGDLIAYQGYVGKNVLETIEYTSEGKDPKDGTYFSYYLTKDKKYYQLMTMLEEDNSIATAGIFNKTYAIDYSIRYPKVYGKKLGILTDENNIPIQELTGSLDVATTTNNYIARFKDNENIQGTGSVLNIIGGMAKLGGNITKAKGKSCKDILDKYGRIVNGIYEINPTGYNSFKVYCDMTTDGGGWTRLYLEDYENSTSGWSQTNTITTCGSYGKILGGYNVISGQENKKTFDLKNIIHSEVKAKLDYIKIDSWDNEEAYVKLNGNKLFSKNNIYTNGTNICGNSPISWKEEKELVNIKMNDSFNSLDFIVGSTLNEGAGNESYGIDNLEIYVR